MLVSGLLCAQQPDTIFRATATITQYTASALPGSDWNISFRANDLRGNPNLADMRVGAILFDGDCMPLRLDVIVTPASGPSGLITGEFSDIANVGNFPSFGAGAIVQPSATGMIGLVQEASERINSCLSWYNSLVEITAGGGQTLQYDLLSEVPAISSTNDRIFVVENESYYQIQSDSVAGFENDNVAVIEMSNGSFAVLQPFNGGYDVRSFGAVGDGVANDVPALNKALLFAGALDAGLLSYNMNHLLNSASDGYDNGWIFTLRYHLRAIDISVDWKFINSRLTIADNPIEYGRNNAAMVIVADNKNIDYVRFDGIVIDGQNSLTNNVSSSGISVHEDSAFYVQDVVFQNFKITKLQKGAVRAACRRSLFENGYINNCSEGTSLLLGADFQSVDFANHFVNNITIDSAGYLPDGSGISLTGAAIIVEGSNQNAGRNELLTRCRASIRGYRQIDCVRGSKMEGSGVLNIDGMYCRADTSLSEQIRATDAITGLFEATVKNAVFDTIRGRGAIDLAGTLVSLDGITVNSFFTDPSLSSRYAISITGDKVEISNTDIKGNITINDRGLQIFSDNAVLRNITMDSIGVSGAAVPTVVTSGKNITVDNFTITNSLSLINWQVQNFNNGLAEFTNVTMSGPGIRTQPGTVANALFILKGVSGTSYTFQNNDVSNVVHEMTADRITTNSTISALDPVFPADLVTLSYFDANIPNGATTWIRRNGSSYNANTNQGVISEYSLGTPTVNPTNVDDLTAFYIYASNIAQTVFVSGGFQLVDRTLGNNVGSVILRPGDIGVFIRDGLNIHFVNLGEDLGTWSNFDAVSALDMANFEITDIATATAATSAVPLQQLTDSINSRFDFIGWESHNDTTYRANSTALTLPASGEWVTIPMANHTEITTYSPPAGDLFNAVDTTYLAVRVGGFGKARLDCSLEVSGSPSSSPGVVFAFDIGGALGIISPATFSLVKNTRQNYSIPFVLFSLDTAVANGYKLKAKSTGGDDILFRGKLVESVERGHTVIFGWDQ